MSEDFDGKIEIRLDEVKAEFEKLDQEKTQLNERRSGHVNQVSAIDRRINEINVSQIGLNARYNELLGLLPEDKQVKFMGVVNVAEEKKKKQQPKETTVSPKNEKEKKK